MLTIASALITSGIAVAQPTRAIDADFADPCVIQANDGYYAFATGGNGVNVQVATSSDFASWELLSGTDAMPGPFPGWVAGAPAIWAPDVIERVSLNTSIQTLINTMLTSLLGRRNIRDVFLYLLLSGPKQTLRRSFHFVQHYRTV